MGLVPTLLAIGVGVFLGLRWGGRADNLLNWRPPLWEAFVGGFGLLVLLDLLPWSGPFVAFLRIVGMALMLGFAVINVRVGGMVLVVAGVGMNLFVTLINWGLPVNGSALVSAGMVERSELARVVLHGGREVADGSVLAFLGGVLPLPWGQVVSVGDLLLLVGVTLVVASGLRRYEVVGASPFGPIGGGRGAVPRDYRDALDALGRGPAPRRGPGLHPSRMGGSRGLGGPRGMGPARRRPGTRPR